MHSVTDDVTNVEVAENVSFVEYSQSNPNQQLAYKDNSPGEGIGAESGQVLTVAYKGRILSNGEQFDQGENYSFRLGGGRVMPGWEEGIVGMRVGGMRTLRIPPRLAFGDRWVKGTIPPNSHLEFDIELKGIASNPLEETWLLLNIGPGRVATGVFSLALFAIAPMLS